MRKHKSDAVFAKQFNTINNLVSKTTQNTTQKQLCQLLSWVIWLQKTNLAVLGRLGAPSETPLSFCRALAGSSEIPPGTCPSLL